MYKILSTYCEQIARPGQVLGPEASEPSSRLKASGPQGLVSTSLVLTQENTRLCVLTTIFQTSNGADAIQVIW